MTVQEIIRSEERRQKETLALIPSENYPSAAVQAALGTIFAAKYAEGYPHKRYYPGNAVADELETLAQNQALRAFSLDRNTWHVNVQPYSGSPANAPIYLFLFYFF